MSKRIALVLSLVTAVSSVAGVAVADRAYSPPAPTAGAPAHRFAEPPPSSVVAVAPMRERPSEVALDATTVRAALARRRAASLAAFRAYEAGGVFPSNVYRPGSLNVWRDQDGHFCAAATIIRASGQVALVDRVADQNNFIRLADVSTGPLMDWMLTSGLTKEELVTIQRPFMPVTTKPEPTPTQRIAVQQRLRAQETTRLTRLYTQIEHDLDAHQDASLELATARLMKHPQLAWALIDNS